MDIAIFGGSFDPFHIGHEKIIDTVLNNIKLDKLFIIPTYLNPFKNTFHLDSNTRLELIKDLYNSHTMIDIIDYEVKKKEKTTTYETINYLKSIYNLNKIYLVIGADNLKNIHLWYNYKNLRNLVSFIIITRDKIDISTIPKNSILLELQENISSTRLRQNMDINYIPQKIQNRIKKLWKIE